MNDKLLCTAYLFKKVSTQFYFYIFVVGRIEESTVQYNTIQMWQVAHCHQQPFLSWPSCISMLANTLWQLPGASVDSALVTLCHFIFILIPAVSVFL